MSNDACWADALAAAAAFVAATCDDDDVDCPTAAAPSVVPDHGWSFDCGDVAPEFSDELMALFAAAQRKYRYSVYARLADHERKSVDDGYFALLDWNAGLPLTTQDRLALENVKRVARKHAATNRRVTPTALVTSAAMYLGRDVEDELLWTPMIADRFFKY
ncbi:hypothetical protein GGI04_000033 [Coemansia thaxteri]|nr:hypothetical protein GGI04_000033 [Coemansia thaxteri]KAJ2474280.1 hypothetical protein GGI02_000173 [Coemansia sp. RSA 2322]